jgi:hypothetical protein
VLEDGRRWGEAAHDFQWRDAQAILAPWGLLYHWCGRPRGGSKTTDVAAIGPAAMLTQAPCGRRMYALAADRDQGRLLLDAIAGFAARTPLLRDALKISSYRVAMPARDVVLEILAADAAGSWGLRPYLVIVDEICQWAETRRSRDLFEAVRTATIKTRGRLVIISTAGDPTHFAHEIREHARLDPLCLRAVAMATTSPAAPRHSAPPASRFAWGRRDRGDPYVLVRRASRPDGDSHDLRRRSEQRPPASRARRGG